MSAFRFSAALIGLAIAATGAAPSLAQDYKAGGLTISHPWLRPTPPGAPTAAGYLTITNHGATPDSLLSGSSAEFRGIEVHEMSMTGQIMRMRPIVGGLVIASGQSVVLAPGGDRHLMLVGPKRPIAVGDKIPATLQFAKAGSVKVTFIVHEIGRRATPPMHTLSAPSMSMN